ncbi:hypothetical protein FEM48_Zijuj08G0139400 [Ziziphus jujuba var. spinosa]|uniref:Uncharacterized protein n=1 Tax=Ziziphus jujuba var. spinosa TaxID=714518 RepID=A0A978UZH9_ZIZJJ|nr:hypothetical protein FEM48_Zijuj08G0139400 [Ziziphus jujuba var. spinosa]
MEIDDVSCRRRSSYFSGCMMSPLCFSVHEDQTEYSRIDYCNSSQSKRRQRWRNFLKRLVRDSKTIYGSKPTSFKYDAVSYSQNFDEGFHSDQEPRRHSQVFPVVRWDLGN